MKGVRRESLADFFGFLAIWVSISSASVLVVMSGAPAEVCAFWRTFITSIMFLPIALHRKNFSIKLHHLVAGFFLGLHFLMWMQSLFLLPVYQSTLIVVSYPVFNVVFDYIFFHEKPSFRKISGFIITLMLLAIFLKVSELHLNIGVFLALTASLFAAGYFQVGRYARYRVGEPILEYATPTYIIASLTALVYAIFNGSNILFYDATTYFYFILLALIPMIGGHTLMNYYMRKYSTSTVTSIALGEPFGAGLLGMILLGQSLSAFALFLGFLIVFCIIVLIH
ncbi:MAG: DMT family transporter [Thermosphaera sp.]